MEKEESDSYKKAGEIAKKVVEYVKDYVQHGMLLIDIANKIDAKIEKEGGKPAFPVNLSLNEVAAHYTPSLKDETVAEGLLKVDIGVEVNGYIADTAFSLDLTDDKRYEDMIALNEKLLEEAIKNVVNGVKVGKIGNAIQDKLGELDKKAEYSVIKNLSGHLLGKHIVHAGLTISNYRNDSTKQVKDMAIAIEPFLTKGQGEVYEGKESEIFMLENDKSVRDADTRKLLAFIKEEYKTKPFCKRWLEKKDFNKLDFSLKTLVREKILHNFPMLIEKSKKPVSQAEHTLLVLDSGIVVTTR